MTIIVQGSGLTFLDAVNRILRIQGFIRGDTDVLTSFSDTNHNATSNICQIAIQSEIQDLMSNSLLSYERATGTITLLTSTRTYSLANDFVRFYGDPPFIYDATQNYQIWEYRGGEDQLRKEILTYKTDLGAPNWYYDPNLTVWSVGFYPVPDASVNNRVLSYEYEKTITPGIATDLMPFQTPDETYAFCDAAARRFKYLYEGKNDIPVSQDPVWKESMSRLMAMMRGKNPSKRYGRDYA
jgi:hypothetical protein